MTKDGETVIVQVTENLDFSNFNFIDFDRVLSFFNWSLFDSNIEIASKMDNATIAGLIYLYLEICISNKCNVRILGERWTGSNESNPNKMESLMKDIPTEFGVSVFGKDDGLRNPAWKVADAFIKGLDIEYDKSFRYIVNELLYNTNEHGKNGNIPSLFQSIWNAELNELSLIVADVGIGIRKHLRQTYPNLSTDSEAILHSIKPQISGTFGRASTGYETKNNAGVGLFFSSSIAQRLNADMFIVSGNGFVHISPTEIIAKELDNQWKGTFVYVKMKLGLIKDLNFQKMLAEITKSIPKAVKVTEENNLYISIMNYFGKYAEDKDLAKKIRDKYLLPALAENKSLTVDFEDIVSAPHSLLNAMLATPIERLGLSAYKKIKIINAAPEIRETLDFIFDDNTSNA
jgi:hypothetical protein